MVLMRSLFHISRTLFCQNEFKKELPCISNCMVIGDKRKFLTILIALKIEVTNNSAQMMPKDVCTIDSGTQCRRYYIVYSMYI